MFKCTCKPPRNNTTLIQFIARWTRQKKKKKKPRRKKNNNPKTTMEASMTANRPPARWNNSNEKSNDSRTTYNSHIVFVGAYLFCYFTRNKWTTKVKWTILSNSPILDRISQNYSQYLANTTIGYKTCIIFMLSYYYHYTVIILVCSMMVLPSPPVIEVPAISTFIYQFSIGILENTAQYVPSTVQLSQISRIQYRWRIIAHIPTNTHRLSTHR